MIEVGNRNSAVRLVPSAAVSLHTVRLSHPDRSPCDRDPVAEDFPNLHIVLTAGELTEHERLRRNFESSEYLASELSVLRQVARRVIQDPLIAGAAEIPIVSVMQGGLFPGVVLSEELQAAGKSFRLWGAAKSFRDRMPRIDIPEAAVAMARTCGLLVCADDVAYNGKTLRRFFQSLPAEFESEGIAIVVALSRLNARALRPDPRSDYTNAIPCDPHRVYVGEFAHGGDPALLSLVAESQGVADEEGARRYYREWR